MNLGTYRKPAGYSDRFSKSSACSMAVRANGTRKPQISSDHSRCFLFGGQPPLRRELIDKLRQMLAQPFQELVTVHTGLAAQRIERVAAERMGEISGRDFPIRSGSYPRFR